MITPLLQETRSNVYGILCATIVAFFLSIAPPLSSVESVASDHRIARLSSSTALDPDIVIVALDDATMEKLSFRQPMDRAFLAKLVREVSKGSPRIIGLDVILDQPTRAEPDKTLKSAISTAPVKIVGATSAAGATPFLKNMVGNKSWGVATFQVDASDSVVRRLSLPSPDNPTFTQALLQSIGVAMPPDIRRMRWPLQNSGAVPFVTIPAHLVASGAVDPLIMRSKIVLIGTTANGVDRHMTPLSVLPAYADGLPGVVVHAFAIKTLPRQIPRCNPTPPSILS